MIYMFSDGFPDQFGGPAGKKYKHAAFKKILLENHEKDMLDQRELLDFEIEKWMSFNDPVTKTTQKQIDDITVVGIKI